MEVYNIVDGRIPADESIVHTKKQWFQPWAIAAMFFLVHLAVGQN